MWTIIFATNPHGKEVDRIYLLSKLKNDNFFQNNFRSFTFFCLIKTMTIEKTKIQTLYNSTTSGRITRTSDNKLLRFYVKDNDYLYVRLSRHNYYVHRLLAL